MTSNFYEVAVAPTDSRIGCTTGLAALGDDINAPNRDGMPPVFVAFYVGDVAEASTLLSRSPNKALTINLEGNPTTLVDLLTMHREAGREVTANALSELLVRPVFHLEQSDVLPIAVPA